MISLFMRKFLFAIFFIILMLSKNCNAQVDTVKIGAYITSIYDIKLNDESYNIDFWLWFHYKNDSLNPLKTIEIVNAKESVVSYDHIEVKNNIIWAFQKYKATINNPWNIENFPFDKQQLKIVIEESVADTSTMMFLTDFKNSTYDSILSISGWKITNFKIDSKYKTYNTTYGDPKLTGTSSIPQTVISFMIERDGWTLFVKLFTGVYVAFFISIMVFFIDPVDVDPRFGLSVGAIFAAVGNKYIVDSILPEVTTFTLADKVHNITFVYLLLSIALSVYSLYKFKKGKEKASKKIDKYSFICILISFVMINVYIIYNSVNNA